MEVGGGGGESSSSGSWLATGKRVENYLYFSSLRDIQKSQVERWYPLLGRMVSTTLFHVALTDDDVVVVGTPETSGRR